MRAGEMLEIIEGINAPVLQKSIGENLPEGLLDTGDDAAPREDEGDAH